MSGVRKKDKKDDEEYAAVMQKYGMLGGEVFE